MNYDFNYRSQVEKDTELSLKKYLSTPKMGV